ncbi:protein phosphatase 2C and cyclic nucleotide-binding/kinase domain-containing protein isoform X2 [Jatropha curcas]|uniref:protein phosphatase 2C and cyclic nucleotide-binding/kinase domain-containing protein isoform X2 n=1 Tax=Jatropha curcas TaxID=180498 RepID=UPI0009D72567|nr:protein phosphatase 2C and cyclic nucleotide-binding/kinase domain-containing protein isoform X2 [Jatropha curcas]
MGCVYSRACIGEVCAPRDPRIKQQQQQQPQPQPQPQPLSQQTGQNARGNDLPVFSPASSSPESETRDQINQLNLTRDPELGITRLSRVSSQFLPPDGSRTVRVPSAHYELRYSYLSQRGYYPDALDKANQDSFCIHTPFGTNPDDHFFGVFDGHGEFGAQCSQFVKRKLCENLLRSSKFQVDAVEACHSAFLTTNSQLHADSLDDSMSGTTAITVLVRGRTIYVANSGDSRAIIAERRGKDISAIDLSIDQTPFRADELERVKLCGARVLTLDQIEGLKNPDVQCWGTEEGDDGDPPRLWVPNGMYPGTAFTRSMGDSIAETIGVVANPEIVVLELTPQHPFFVLASDGVFEFLSSQSVVEMAHIERALHDHFLFRRLTDSQCHVLLDCMQRVEVQPGEVVVKQGGEGDCFYVVGSGEFEVFATQEEKNGDVPKVLQSYTAEKMSSFGELALMYNKPLQASVRAVTSGTLWALKREDFRGILMSEFSNLSSLKLLRTVDLLSRLTILQLSHIADSLSEVSFSDGQTIVNETEGPSALYIIQRGQVRLTFDAENLSSPNAGSLKSDNQTEDDCLLSGKKLSLEKTEGSYFGEWTLLGEHIGSLSAVAVGDCVCSILTKENFDSVVGPLTKLSQEVEKSRSSSSDFSKESAESTDLSAPLKVRLSDLEWRTCLYATDCSEIGLVLLKDSENLLSLKRFSKQKIKRLGKEAQVLKEKNLVKSISPSARMPQVLCTCADRTHAGILLNTCLACPLASILHTALDEPSAKFCAASVIIALQDLHKNGVLYRGVSPDILMLDQTGNLQLVDFRFGKKLSGERTFTICGMADSLAPEIVQGKGHGLPADWWALGVLIYFMLQGEMPFGSWRESELDTYAKIAKGQINLPPTFSCQAADLITKLLEVDEDKRLGSDSIKSHPWFDGIDWKRLRDGSYPVPHDITSRVTQYLESHHEDCTIPPTSPARDIDDLNVPEWLDDW